MDWLWKCKEVIKKWGLFALIAIFLSLSVLQELLVVKLVLAAPAVISIWATLWQYKRSSESLRQEMVQKLNALAELQLDLDEFRAAASEASTPDELRRLSDIFFGKVLKTTCYNIFAPTTVPATVMLEYEDVLQIAFYYPKRLIDPTFSIPLQRKKASGMLWPKDNEGIAGFAFCMALPIYVPYIHINKKEDLPKIRVYTLQYEAKGKFKREPLKDCAWKLSGRQITFKSMLSVPIMVVHNQTTGDADIYGVLNLENPNRDAFKEEDFHFANLVASILAQGISILRANQTRFIE